MVGAAVGMGLGSMVVASMKRITKMLTYLAELPPAKRYVLMTSGSVMMALFWPVLAVVALNDWLELTDLPEPYAVFIAVTGTIVMVTGELIWLASLFIFVVVRITT